MRLGPGPRRHERGFTLVYLALVAAFVGVLALPPLRQLAFRAVAKAVRGWDGRWTRRVELGEALVREGRYEEAVAYLVRLDRTFPARDVRHARDKERERILVALGRSYAELDRKQRAMETYQRLVAFDPRNYRNSYALALAANRLLAGWAPAPEARDAFLQVLAIHPSHLPSVRGAIAYYSARGEFAEVVRLLESYVDASIWQPVTVSLGEGVQETISLSVDGEWHEAELILARPAGWSGALRLEADGFPFTLERATLTAPARVGVMQLQRVLDLPTATARPPAQTGMGGGSGQAAGPHTVLALPLPPQPEGVSSVRLRLRFFKPIDATTWNMVAAAYRNRLDLAGLEAVRGRLLLLPSAAAADSVLLRPEWATEGLGVGADDSRYP